MNDEFAVTELWPVLAYDEMAPTVDHLHRLSQIAGKYTLDQPFEPFWSNVPLVVTPRGFGTRTLRAGDVLFDVEYAVLDDRVDVTASTGRVTLPLAAGSVADFYARFVRAVAPLKIAAPRTTLESEIPGSFHLDTDSQPRPYDAAAARRMWAAFAGAAGALNAWQSSYRGPRLHPGIMWGGFDLYAARYSGRSIAPPSGRPVFQQNGMNGETVAVGMSFGDPNFRAAYFFAYVAPSLAGIESADFAVEGAAYDTAAGLVRLPWENVRAGGDPLGTVLRFADAVYAVAVKLGGWPSDWVVSRHDGWYASRHLIP
ncbi:MAG TPA: DUF5996 family protein [Candidatus Tumulicola sp.]